MTHTHKNSSSKISQFKRQSVKKRTDEKTLPIALPSWLTRSVMINESINQSKQINNLFWNQVHFSGSTSHQLSLNTFRLCVYLQYLHLTTSELSATKEKVELKVPTFKLTFSSSRF